MLGCFYCIDLTLVSFYLLMAAGIVLSDVPVLYNYAEVACIHISGPIQAVLKSVHQELFQLTIGQVASQHPVLCNGEELKVLK